MLKSNTFRAALLACCISAMMAGAADAQQRGGRGIVQATNGASIDQQGSGNGGAVVQSGAGNEAALRQYGDGNTGTITQTGDNNTACLMQIGDGLNGSIVQTGDRRRTSVLQTESGSGWMPYGRCKNGIVRTNRGLGVGRRSW